MASLWPQMKAGAEGSLLSMTLGEGKRGEILLRAARRDTGGKQWPCFGSPLAVGKLSRAELEPGPQRLTIRSSPRQNQAPIVHNSLENDLHCPHSGAWQVPWAFKS